MELSVTIIIIAITIGTSLFAWNRPHILQKWLFNPYAVNTRNEYHRFITSGFIHQGYMHLFFNMFTLYFFGAIIEQVFGYVFFLVLYLVGIIISDIPTYFKHKNNPGYNALGASGGVSAVLFSSILINPTANLYLFAILPIPGFILGALFIIYSIQRGKHGNDNINHDAHLYGALFGIALTILLQPMVIPHFFEQLRNYKIF